MIRVMAPFLRKLDVNEHRRLWVLNRIYSRSSLLVVNIIGDHDDELHRGAIRAAVLAPLVPEKVFNPKTTRLLCELGTKGSIACNDDRNTSVPSKKGPEDGDGLPRTGGQNREHTLVFIFENCRKEKLLIFTRERGPRTSCIE